MNERHIDRYARLMRGLPSGDFQLRYRNIGMARSAEARNEGCGLIASLIRAVRWGRAYDIPAPVPVETFREAMVRLAHDARDGTVAFDALGFDVVSLGPAQRSSGPREIQ